MRRRAMSVAATIRARETVSADWAWRWRGPCRPAR
jgi:hypothetical protein